MQIYYTPQTALTNIDYLNKHQIEGMGNKLWVWDKTW